MNHKGIKKTSAYKRIRKAAKRATRDRLLWHRLPSLYREAAETPVDERKVVFVETKLRNMPDAFKSLWRWLDMRCDFDLIYVTLNQNRSSYCRYVRNCERLVAALGDARYIVLNDASDVVSCLPLRPETEVLQLWHACGAFKKWGMSTADLKFGGSRAQKERHPYYKHLDLVTVSSPEVEWAYREAMELESRPETVRALGVSRSDIYFDPNFVVSARERVEANFPACKGKKIIAYVPTFRGHVKTAKSPRQLDISTLRDALGDEYVLLVKHHPFVKRPPRIPEGCEDFAFRVGGKAVIETLLCASDVCVTDYSSVMFDYSLLGRPIAFFAPDLDEYTDWRGFYYDYDEITPGPVFRESGELAEWISHAGERFDARAVEMFRSKFMSACDGHATERIAQAFFGEALVARALPDAVEEWVAQDPGGVDISIVVPAYNAGGTLGRAIESVLAQTYSRERMELIVVDDCSDDETGEVIERYALAYPGLVRTARTEQRSGTPAAPRNIGLEMARGRYVFFLDADDWIGNQAVKRMLEHAHEWGSDVIVVKMRGHNGRPVPRSMFKSSSAAVDVYRSKVMWTLAPLKLFRRELVADLRFPDFMPEDMSFVLRALVASDVVSVASDYDYYHVTFEQGAGEHASTGSWNDVESNMRAYYDLFGFIDGHVPEGEGEHVLLKRLLRRDVLQTLLTIAYEGEAGESRFTELVELTGRYYAPGVYETSPVEKRLVHEAAFNWGFRALRDLAARLADERQEPYAFLDYAVSPESAECLAFLGGRTRGFDVTRGVRLKATVGRASWKGSALLLDGHLAASHLFFALADLSRAAIVALDANDAEAGRWPCKVEWEGVSRDIQLDHPASGAWAACVDAGGAFEGVGGRETGDSTLKLFLEIDAGGFVKRASLKRPPGISASPKEPLFAARGFPLGFSCSLERPKGDFSLVGHWGGVAARRVVGGSLGERRKGNMTMSFKAVWNNLWTVGPRETWEIHLKDEEARRIEGIRAQEIEQLAVELYEHCYGGPYFDKMPKAEHEELMALVKQKEERLAEMSKSVFSAYSKHVKAFYLKELSPRLYAQWSAAPVEEKVVFVEKDGPRTQPNSHLSDKIKEQGRYRVVMIGLRRGQASKIGLYENALRAIRECATAKAVFISSANNVFSQFDLRPETKLIQLWHGLGMYKRVGYSTLESGDFGMSAEDREEYPQYRNYTYVTIPSEEQAWTFEDAMRIPADSGVLQPVGVARTDVFFDDARREAALAKLHEALPATAGKKAILYAPTYRGRVSKATGPDRLDVPMMAEALGDEYVLLVKHHGFAKNVKPIPEPYRDTFAFDMAEHRVLSIDRMLHIADVCITDYSSIGFEYAILERPIVFFAYDLEDYIDKRGMYYDYDEVTPGPICRETSEVVDYIAHLDERFDAAEVRAFKERFVGACDGHSTERTIALIEK